MTILGEAMTKIVKIIAKKISIAWTDGFQKNGFFWNHLQPVINSEHWGITFELDV